MITKEMLETEFYNILQATKILGVNRHRISVLLSQNRFEGAFKFSDAWLIPKSAVDNFERKPQGNFTNHKRGSKAKRELADWLERYESQGTKVQEKE